MKVRDEAYKYYFYFIQERMRIFWNRYEGSKSILTSDKILAQNKFTNVYRAQDRVSQYLIRDVIYKEGYKSFNEIDTLLRIIVFKIFNKIDTWKFIENEVGVIQSGNFDVSRISIKLAERINNTPIFNGAYMMTGSHQKYKMYYSKHEKWLRMVEQELIKERRLEKIIKAKSLDKIFNILSECSFIGDFLAYQYAIDLNYSEVIDFDENSFVKAGIGAIRGIKKCFEDYGKNSFEDCIKYTQDNLLKYQQLYGYTEFKPLFGRELKLIDLQNCFCETDKYLRVKIPELAVGNVRIKQKFSVPKGQISFFFPPKWGINKLIKPCIVENLPELTLF